LKQDRLPAGEWMPHVSSDATRRFAVHQRVEWSLT